MLNVDPPDILLLDTHAWLWFAEDAPEIRRSPAVTIVNAAADKQRLRVSAISVWELAMKESKGRVQLTGGATAWVHGALSDNRIALVPLSPEIAVHSTRLPGQELIHGDPADRIIAATARVLNATLLTRDGGLLDYAKHGYIRAISI
ncbi:MAG: type II toxin-antitoxin system VapC family toxin [Phycisphaerae bacterium]|nr:type II toxin-antitoxin system VapC family toxin [Phycisphaerae bacterium]